MPWQDVEEGVERSLAGNQAGGGEGGAGNWQYYVRMYQEGRRINADFNYRFPE